MYWENEIFKNYDLLLPPKYDGGFLIIALYHKIQNEQIDKYFTIKEIDVILNEIAIEYTQPVSNWSRLKDILFNYYIRSLPNENWKYYLTEYAKNVVELIQNRLDNPYKKYHLKESIEKKFIVRRNQIKSIDDLEITFGRGFVQEAKKMIANHLDALEDELQQSYKKLNEILLSKEENATKLVKNFAVEFGKFGTRAEEITQAILSKDKFLRDLQFIVDSFFNDAMDIALESIDKESKIKDWNRAKDVFSDLSSFFNYVEDRLSIIRKQIYNASGKLSELEEYFSARAALKGKIKSILRIALNDAQHTKNGIVFSQFPLKIIVFEKVSFLYPVYYEFGRVRTNPLMIIPADKDYEQSEKNKILATVNQRQIVNKWVENTKDKLHKGEEIVVNELMNIVANQEPDASIPYLVASEIIAYVNEVKHLNIKVSYETAQVENKNLVLWKTKIHQ